MSAMPVESKILKVTFEELMQNLPPGGGLDYQNIFSEWVSEMVEKYGESVKRKIDYTLETVYNEEESEGKYFVTATLFPHDLDV